MNTRHRSIAFLLLLVMFGCDRKWESQTNTEKDEVVLYCSGDTAGWITPCGCTSGQSGGMSRRASIIESETGNAIYVDVGGTPAGVTEYHLEKFLAILNGEKELGVAAHNLGIPELNIPSEAWGRLAEQSQVPFLTTNAEPSTTTNASTAWLKKSIFVPSNAGLIQILGIVSPRLPLESNWKVSDPKQAVLSEIAKSKADVRVLLAYAEESELIDLAKSIPELSFVIGGPTGQTLPPRRYGRAIVSSATNKGKYLVKATLFGPADERLTATKVIEVRSELPQNPKQDLNLDRFYELLKQRDFSALETGIQTVRVPHDVKDYEIAGSDTCLKCHNADQHVWLGSHHSHAFASIEKSKAHFEPACQVCHTTGYALPGGFETVASSADRLGVGCENCHGPSLAHVNQPTKRTPFNAVDQCRKCHDLENSPKFDYALYWPKIAHGKK
jgi:nitrate reductase cytochrome c-type subunit